MALKMHTAILAMKLFHFYRNNDETGVSGTGPVVEGVQFTNGWCALRWISNKSSLCFYQSLEEVKAIHSHGGKTEIIVHDFEPVKKRTTEVSNDRMEMLMRIIEESSHAINLSEEKDCKPEQITQAINQVRKTLEEFENLLVHKPKRVA